MTSLSILSISRFKHFNAIDCTVLLFHLFLSWSHCIYLTSVVNFMSCFLMLVFIVVLLISNTADTDEYTSMISLYELSWSWEFSINLSTVTFIFPSINISLLIFILMTIYMLERFIYLIGFVYYVVLFCNIKFSWKVLFGYRLL